MADLGTFVAVLREKKGWTQRELARRARFSATTIQKIESGDRDPNIATLVAIAEALKVSEQSLIDVWKGKEPDSADELQDFEAAAVDFAKHFPNRLLMEVLYARRHQVFQAMLAAYGKDEIRELMSEVLRGEETC